MRIAMSVPRVGGAKDKSTPLAWQRARDFRKEISMASPTRQQLQDWAKNYVALWNAGDREGWARNWRSVAPGDFRMLDPVGTPEKCGFELCALKSWDLFQARVKFRVVDGTLFICGNEVAWVLEN